MGYATASGNLDELQRLTDTYACLDHAQLVDLVVQLRLERDLAFAFASDLARQLERMRNITQRPGLQIKVRQGVSSKT
jgi:hypothetical protein